MMRPHREFPWPTLLVVCAAGSLTILGATAPPARAQQLGAELSFDDGPDGSSDDEVPGPAYPLRNAAEEGGKLGLPFDPTGPRLRITLEGEAKRTDMTGGKYGRAIDLDGAGDSIKVTNLYPGFDTPDLYGWWRLRSGTNGVFWSEECRFAVGINNSVLYVTVSHDDCVSSTTYPSALTWPDFTQWHHLSINRYTSTPSGQQFALTIDFDYLNPEKHQVLSTISVPPMPATYDRDIHFGLDIDGWVDELQAVDFPPSPETEFDYNPANCGKDVPLGWCLEDVATALEANLGQFSWDVPVRFKVIYDPTGCTSDTPCRVVFVLSGGGRCADNYAEVGDGFLKKIVEAAPPPPRSHLAVVVVDPICWAWDFEPYPDEISQVLAVKAAIASLNFLNVSEYYAAGCSHGAGQVLRWAVLDDALPAEPGNYPKRTFARSASDSGEHVDCEYHESWCGEKQKLFDEVNFKYNEEVCSPPIEFPWPHDHVLDPPCVDSYFDRPELTPFVDLLPVVLQTRSDLEIGRSWGVATPGNEVCHDCGPDCPSEIRCGEEGSLAATDGGRQFRNAWRGLENPAQKTGFFIENNTANCLHCKLTPEQLTCVVLYLEGGRSSMLQADPSCEGWDINPGEAAKTCSPYPL